jgi:hypothetical protein
MSMPNVGARPSYGPWQVGLADDLRRSQCACTSHRESTLIGQERATVRVTLGGASMTPNVDDTERSNKPTVDKTPPVFTWRGGPVEVRAAARSEDQADVKPDLARLTARGP